MYPVDFETEKNIGCKQRKELQKNTSLSAEYVNLNTLRFQGDDLGLS